MTHFQWRRFMFFDIEKDVDKNSLSEVLGEDSEVTSVSGGRGLLVFGDSSGQLHFFDRKLVGGNSISVFSGMSIKLVQRASKSGLIVCVSGSKTSDNLVKIYDVDTKQEKSGSSLANLVRTTRLNQGSLGGCPSALAVDDDLNLLAVGLDNGTLILIRGDLRRDRGTKQKVLLSSGSGSGIGISGLAFRGSKLYVATSNEVLYFNVSNKDKETCASLDDIGCDAGNFIFNLIVFFLISPQFYS